MTSKIDIVSPKTVKVFELDEFEKLLKGVKVAACMLTESQPVGEAEKVVRYIAIILTYTNLKIRT